jgi:glucose-6-phosphate isomerase
VAELTITAGLYQPRIEAALAEMAAHNVLGRIWQAEPDYTLWKPDPTEISNRLGWLTVAARMRGSLAEIHGLAAAARADGYTDVLLLGMGGSSLAPDVFRRTFDVPAGALRVHVLDSTDPVAVLEVDRQLDLARTLIIVATKSGGTVETISAFKYFYNRVMETAGAGEAGGHFVAITDDGSSLAAIGQKHRFRHIFLNDPNIGGRYSVMSHFGMVPAALAGIDTGRLLARAEEAAGACGPAVQAGQNPAARLGVFMSELALAGRDKLAFIISPPISSFGDWVEQLVAESTGKEGAGILPVVGETAGAPGVYGEDRAFAYLRLDGDDTFDAAVTALEQAGHPVARLSLRDVYDLGAQFFVWELATAIAGHRLGINPFDQPNVEAAKVLARRMVAGFTQTGRLPEQSPDLTDGDIAVYGAAARGDMAGALAAFLGQAQPGDYLAVQAYLTPGPEADRALGALQAALRDRTQLAATVGYGPRFLHSTGQLHKGDGGRGLFIQITADAAQDAPIPDEAGRPDSSMSFGVLIAAQAMGDRQALIDAGRRVIRFHLTGDAIAGLRRLADACAGT